MQAEDTTPAITFRSVMERLRDELEPWPLDHRESIAYLLTPEEKYCLRPAFSDAYEAPWGAVFIVDSCETVQDNDLGPRIHSLVIRRIR